MQRVLTVVTALVMGLLTRTAPAQDPDSLQVGDKVPPLSAKDVNGRTVSWEDLGSKAVIMYFHSEQMAYSQQGLRDVVEALSTADDLHDSLVLMVVTNGEEDIADLRALLDTSHVTWRLFVDPQRRAFSRYHVVAFPSTFAVGPDRTIKSVSKGYGPLLTLKVLAGARHALGLLTDEQFEESLHSKPERSIDADQLRVSRTVRMVKQLMAAGMLDEARESLLKAIDDKSEHTEGIAMLARIYLRQDRAADAAKWIVRLESLSPKSVELRYLRARLELSENKPDVALKLLEDQVDSIPEVALLRGMALEQKGDFQAAAALYRKALETQLER